MRQHRLCNNRHRVRLHHVSPAVLLGVGLHCAAFREHFVKAGMWPPTAQQGLWCRHALRLGKMPLLAQKTVDLLALQAQYSM